MRREMVLNAIAAGLFLAAATALPAAARGHGGHDGDGHRHHRGGGFFYGGYYDPFWLPYSGFGFGSPFYDPWYNGYYSGPVEDRRRSRGENVEVKASPSSAAIFVDGIEYG